VEIKDLFGDNYILIDKCSDILIYEFMREPSDGQHLGFEAPLTHVFLHKYYTEMFLVLDCRQYNYKEIKEECKKWESRVMSFVNFGGVGDGYKEKHSKVMNFLKYNISLVILCKDEPNEEDDDFRFDTEKSLVICRKIFLLCENDEIIDSNKVILPCYFEPIYKIKPEKMDNIEKELEDLLPNEKDISDDELKKMYKKEKLDESDIEKIGRWLENAY